MRQLNLIFTLFILVLLTSATAGEVFMWTDKWGVTHFSQTPPVEGTPGVHAHELGPLPPAVSPEEDYFSIINQANRLEDRRLARQKARDDHRRGLRRTANHIVAVDPTPVVVRHYPIHHGFKRHHRFHGGRFEDDRLRAHHRPKRELREKVTRQQ
ncbi:MAG: DUF4124 domain-containing protein [Gammaproteobacteria bacterium]